MSDLKEQFEAALQYVQSAEGNFKPDNNLKLDMYSLFKQATEGDVKGKRPGMTSFVERAKWDAWKKLQGMSADDAMKTYIEKINALKAKHG